MVKVVRPAHGAQLYVACVEQTAWACKLDQRSASREATERHLEEGRFDGTSQLDIVDVPGWWVPGQLLVWELEMQVGSIFQVADQHTPYQEAPGDRPETSAECRGGEAQV